MNKSSFDTVNPHYLENVMRAADQHDVVAGEDIHNAAGIKLVAKGQRIDQNMRERLVRFKLREPLERSLTVNAGIGAADILAEAHALLDTGTSLAALFRAKGSSKRALSVLEELRFDQIGTLLLSMQNGIGTLQHSVLVSLLGLAFCIGLDKGYSALGDVALAGLLHDVGELYINPEYLKSGRKLLPEEWKHIAVHPHIGQLVIGEVAGWPQSIAVSIGEHHERVNGFGYPRHLAGDAISPLGKVLLTCEALCGLLVKEKHPVERACLAAKLIPGEYPFEMVSLIADLPSGADLSNQDSAQAPTAVELITRIERVAATIETAITRIEDLRRMEWITPCIAFLDHTHKYLLMLRGALYHTGLSPCYQVETLKGQDGAPGIALELEVVISEIEWRLCELTRQITLIKPSLEEDLQTRLDGDVIPCLVLA
ncbi:MAG: HD domain-containing phosphohydrolase [Syntrophobacteraceae bacterium]